MKNLKLWAFLLVGAALALTGCQNDDSLGDGTDGNGQASSGKYYYVSAGISLPSTASSRSATDDGYPGNEEDDHDQTNSNGDGEDDSEVDDFEYGYDYENDVRTMILVFATKEKDEFLAYTVVSGLEKAPTGSKYDFNVLAEVKYEDLEKAYQGTFLNSSQEVNVYAFCNYTANLEKLLKTATVGDTAWINWNGTVTEGGSGVGESPAIGNTIWANRAFLMTNYENTSTKFPKEIGDWDAYADKNTPFYVTEKGIDGQDEPLAAIRVERSAARLDFRDGSTPYKSAPYNIKTDYTYPILTDVHVLSGDETEEINKNLFNVQLTRMALVNMSKNFYYLRRVSKTGLNTDAVVGGRETTASGSTPYVVDTDAALKYGTEQQPSQIKASNAETYFNFPLYTTSGEYNKSAWYADYIADVLASGKSDDTWTGSSSNKYKIWRYVTENTIPGAENQITVQSTGIVFKGRIIAGKDIEEQYDTNDDFASEEYYVSEKVRTALANADKANDTESEVKGEELPILYSFDGFLYGGWDELIEKAALDGIGGRLYTRVVDMLTELALKYDESSSTYKKDGSGEVLDIETAYLIVTEAEGYDDKSIALTDEEVRALAPVNDITVYAATNEEDGEGWGYYCYYFYWNRHNDNGQSGLMGPMEFATVRNNVYKLSVTAINRFGHPSNKKDDPDPEDEDDPDEKPVRYIQVNVDVLPWVVRVNDIEF